MSDQPRRKARPLAKHFDFREAETRLYDWWQERGWFRPECAPPDAEPFVISIPPPNVTGALHIGHALFCTLEDLMTRYERMRGKAALWLPGSDHAGIATQLQVEQLLREEGTSREEIGYEAFLARTWEWKEQYGGTIVNQLRRLGASCDWERERFTLDAGLSRAVQRAFITLYEQGLIYRGPRLVNWSPGLQTAVSDLEVEREEEDGQLYYFRYPVDDAAPLTVATTRPETILGDSAVAVHPDDERYSAYIGKTARVPRLGRAIPIIADAAVDPDFGSGVLKITPAHDFNDYEIGQRHDLPLTKVLNEDATMNEAAGPTPAWTVSNAVANSGRIWKKRDSPCAPFRTATPSPVASVAAKSSSRYSAHNGSCTSNPSPRKPSLPSAMGASASSLSNSRRCISTG